MYHTISCHIISYHTTLYHIIPYYIISYHIISCIIPYYIMYHTILYHMIPHHPISAHIIPHQLILPYHIMNIIRIAQSDSLSKVVEVNLGSAALTIIEDALIRYQLDLPSFIQLLQEGYARFGLLSSAAKGCFS